jgi:hypothetical protein
MIYGISTVPIPVKLLYSGPIQVGCTLADFPGCLAYAIAWRESIKGEVAGLWPSAVSVLSSDGGRGLYQLTSSWPVDWLDIGTNIRYALTYFLVPSLHFFAGSGLRGDALIRMVAAAFNEGSQAATLDHLLGNVDIGTTGHDYASEVLSNFYKLTSGQAPT